MDRLMILAIALLFAGFLSGGIYTTSPQGNAGAVIVNRFTGNGWYCGATNCFRLNWRESNPN